MEYLQKEATLIEKSRRIVLFQWYKQWRARFYSRNVKTVMTLDTPTQGLIIKKSRTFHPDASPGFFHLSDDFERAGGVVLV